MYYLGGKFRIAKEISKFIQATNTTKRHETYIEPFVGGAWVLREVIRACDFKNIYASDAHEDLILLFKAMQDGWCPPSSITEEEYNKIRNSEPSSLRGFAGFGCSWGGKFFGGYSRDNRGRNYAMSARNSLLEKTKHFRDVSFMCVDYKEINPKNSLIYCDPPYNNTTGYGIKFDHDIFWDTMRIWSELNTVIISEYAAPPDFQCVLEIKTKTDIRTKRGRDQRIERLFVRK